jgi:hypothetical protein
VIFGRAAGLAFVVLAIIMVSAEVVMTLGKGVYNGLATVDAWSLLLGHSPAFVAASESTEFLTAGVVCVIAMPAWVVLLMTSVFMRHLFRIRARRRVFLSKFS